MHYVHQNNENRRRDRNGRLLGRHHGSRRFRRNDTFGRRDAGFRKAVMQVAAAQTGVWVCDGSTQIVPDADPEAA
ncbi:DUF6986 family protein, partial [Nocardia sp. NPDC004260]